MTSVRTLARHYCDGSVLPDAFIEQSLAAIAARDGGIRAFTHLDQTGARTGAAASRERFQRNAPLSILDGVPVAVKDNISVAGLPLTAGMEHRRGMLATDDALIVRRLRRAGAIILGMTNMHEAALGSTTDNPFYGRTDNPAFPGHTPGGSSGGSAAAVAAGFVPLAIGTDTMGSVRLPAGYCGICGFKPTPGILPRSGLIELSWTLDTPGLFAEDPDDLDLVMQVVSGPDPDEVQSRNVPANWQFMAGAEQLSALRIALLGTPGVTLDSAIADAMSSAVSRLTRAGARVDATALGGWDPSTARRSGLLVVEVEGASIHRQALESEAPMSAALRKMLDYGRKLSSTRLAEAYQTLDLLAFRARQFLAPWDVAILPTTPQVAFVHGMSAPSNQADLTALANIAGLPALSLPLPVDPGQAPIGLQLIGKPFEDARLVAIARIVREALQA